MNSPAQQPPTVSAPPQIDPVKLDLLLQELKDQQNLLMGVAGGGIAAVVSAIIWALITVITDYQIGFMAVGVGLLVGFAVRYFGRGMDKIYGFVGAALSLSGCLLGNFLTVVIIVSQQESVNLLEVFTFFLLNPAAVIEAMAITFQPIDLLFYAIALYEGYKFAIRRITQEELARVMR
jgi:hypothetical protein